MRVAEACPAALRVYEGFCQAVQARTIALRVTNAGSCVSAPYSGCWILRSGDLKHSKSLCDLLFYHLCRLTLGIPLVLRIRRVHSTT
jgi:hypothetical protein